MSNQNSSQLCYVDKWHEDPLIGHSRLLTLNKIAQICSKGEVSKRICENKNTIAPAIETALFMDAASKKEYMNQNTLQERLQSLCQRNMKKPTSCQKVGNHPTASHESVHSRLCSSHTRSKRVFPSDQNSTNSICFTGESLYGVHSSHAQAHRSSHYQHHNKAYMGLSKATRKEEMTFAITEKTCHLCEAHTLIFVHVPIYCSSCNTLIKKDGNYYNKNVEDDKLYSVCTSCYNGSKGSTIKVDGISISKDELEKVKNNTETEESWVQCDLCRAWQHQICALYNGYRDIESKFEYICPKCCLTRNHCQKDMPSTISNAVLGAKDLPRTLLGDYIEERLLRCIQQEREEKANATQKKIEEVPTTENLSVRVVLSVEKHLQVNKQFSNIYNGNYPAQFLYCSKVILLFQKIDGADVCLFIMYVQEFGSEIDLPNQRTVYISYLDSVKYFRPERETATGQVLRTFVYHELLLGYLDDSKKRGFGTCYLWASPPNEGQDYILNSHPQNYKVPDPKKLLNWYHSLLDKGVKEERVVNVTNIYYKYFVSTEPENYNITFACLSYFDGDYWHGAAENVLKNTESQTAEEMHKKVKKIISK